MTHQDDLSPSTRFRGSRALLAVVALVLLAVTGATPAGAETKPDVTLNLADSLVIEDALPPVPGYVISRRAEAAPTPENCADGGLADAYCHLYKVNLSVADEVRARGGFLLTAKLEWERGEEVANVPQFGSIGSKQIVMRIYEEPKYVDPETEAETYTAASGLASPSPTVLGVVDPVKPFYWVLVANYFGADNAYKLTLQLDDLVGPGSPVDLSAEEDFPPVFDGSFGAESIDVAPEPSAATLVGPEPAINLSGTAAPPALPSLPGLGAPDFALDGIGGSAFGDEDLEDIVLARGPRPLPPAGDANEALLLLWLVGLPLVVLGAPLGFLWRRRREEAATT